MYLKIFSDKGTKKKGVDTTYQTLISIFFVFLRF